MPEQAHHHWLNALSETETLARSGRIARMVHRPLRYARAMIFRHLIFPLSRKAKVVETETFFGETLNVPLPACTDIYLTGGKSHDSELRLSRFLINRLTSGDTIIDLGAHVGFFTRLCATLCKPHGRVIALEPSADTYKLLDKNVIGIGHITALEAAAGATVGEISFYEFKSSHSEYSSTDAGQYVGESWFIRNQPTLRQVRCETIDGLCQHYQLQPTLIKIDVEGGELDVIRGALQCLTECRPVVVMEFHANGPNRERHMSTMQQLTAMGYRAFSIDKLGKLEAFDPDSVLKDSDNLVFVS